MEPSIEQPIKTSHLGSWYNAIATLRENVKVTWRLSKNHHGLCYVYIVLACLNILTDGFSILLVVPLLDSLTQTSLFTGVPFLGALGDSLSHYEPRTRLRVVAGILFLVITFKAIIQYSVDVLVYTLPLRVERSLRLRTFNILMNAPLSFAETLSPADVGNYAASFPARAGLALRFLVQFIAAFCTLGIVLVFLMSVTPGALLLLLFFAILVSIAFRYLTGPLSRQLDINSTKQQADFSKVFFESINNNRILRALNLKDIFGNRIKTIIDRYQITQIKVIATQNATYPFFSLLVGIFGCASILLISFSPIDKMQTYLGVLLIFLVASTRLLAPFSILHIARMHFNIHVSVTKDLFNFYKQNEKLIEDNGHLDAPRDVFPIEMKDVSLKVHQHSKEDETKSSVDVLKDVNFSINAGEFIVIIGPSGSGKSSVLALLLRLQTPTSGKVLLNGQDLQDTKAESWRNLYSYTSQIPQLFTANVAENISLYQDTKGTEVDYWDALERAQAKDLVLSLPDGLETELNPSGAGLSGGEQQRICLARALYRDTPILILDEATNQQDKVNEERIFSSLEDLQKTGKTVICVSHSSKALEYADKIIIINDGKVTGAGCPEDIDDPFYRKLKLG